jgi:hemolysin activation/secretion protein
VDRRGVTASVAYRLPWTDGDVRFGPMVKYGDTRLAAPVSATHPAYGRGRFGQAGARLDLDLGHSAYAATRGAGGRVTLGGAVFPPIWSVTETFGQARAELAGYVRLPAPARPTLALRAAAWRTFGEYPVHEAAFLGGNDSLRGLPDQRYAGDAAAVFNAELRFRLLSRETGLVQDAGVFALADTGRVFVEERPSERWHRAAGVGLWVSLLRRAPSFSVTVVRSEGDWGLGARTGVMF